MANNNLHSAPISVEELPLVLRVEDISIVLGIGRNTAYDLVRSGQIRSIRIGRQLRIPRNELQRFLDIA